MKNGRGSLLQGIAWAGIGRVAAMAFGFLLTVVLAHGLTPSENGQYFVAFSAVVIFSSLGAIGLDYMVVRFAAVQLLNASNRSVHIVLTKCAAAVAGAATLLCTTLIIFGYAGIGYGSQTASLFSHVLGLAGWIFFAILQRQLAESFRGLGDIRVATILGGLRNNGILNAALGFLCIAGLYLSGNLTLASAILAMAGASALVCVVAAVLLLKDRAKRAPVAVDDVGFNLRSALVQGWPVWLATFVSAGNYMGSAWLVEIFDTSEKVALFGVAQRLVLILMVPMLIINSVLPPVVAQLHAERKTIELERLVRTSSGLGLLASLATLFVVVVAGKPALSFAFGAYYANAHPMLILLCIAQVLSIGLGAWQVVLPMTGGSHAMLITTATAFVAQLVFALLLSSHGAIGVAIAIGLSIFISNSVGAMFVRRNVGISTIALLDSRALANVLRVIRPKAEFNTN